MYFLISVQSTFILTYQHAENNVFSETDGVFTINTNLQQGLNYNSLAFRRIAEYNR